MFAHTLFHEHITRRKWLALAVNILGSRSLRPAGI